MAKKKIEKRTSNFRQSKFTHHVLWKSNKNKTSNIKLKFTSKTYVHIIQFYKNLLKSLMARIIYSQDIADLKI